MSEHAVLVHIPGLPEPADLDEVADLEDVLSDALERVGAGEVDGHEVDLRNGDVTIYTYGADADQLAWVIIKSMVRKVGWSGAYLVKRYGPPGANEERVAMKIEAE